MDLQHRFSRPRLYPCSSDYVGLAAVRPSQPRLNRRNGVLLAVFMTYLVGTEGTDLSPQFSEMERPCHL